MSRYVTIRSKLNSPGSIFNGRPFVLGKPIRYEGLSPRPFRLWRICVFMREDSGFEYWVDDWTVPESEVFEPFVERRWLQPAAPVTA